jgi:membrane protein DedA with SNARE-associated domain
MDLPTWLVQGIDTYGYWAILLAVAIESTGIPFPGETALVVGAVYAATHHTLDIPLVIIAAAAGAILGDNLGYTIGRRGGYPALQRIAQLLHLDLNRLSYSERFFERHGDKTVFFGRFISILRTWVAFLAGLHRMPRRVFFMWNAAGGIVWATVYGTLGYVLGNNIPLLERILRALGIGGIVLLVAVVLAAIGVWWYRRRREARMIEDAGSSEAQSPVSDAESEKDMKRMSSTSQRAGDLLVGLEAGKQRLHAQRDASKHPRTGDAKSGDTQTGENSQARGTP